MKKNSDLLPKLNQLLATAARVYNHSLAKDKKFPEKIQSLSDFQDVPLISKDFFYDFKLADKFAYLKSSRPDSNGREALLPLTKNDYQAYVDSEVSRFKLMGVKKTDRVSVINFTLNESVPIISALIKLGTSYVVTEGELETILGDLLKKRVYVIFTHQRFLMRMLDFIKQNEAKLDLRLVIVTGEPSKNLSLLKKQVKNFLGAELIDTIGSREIGGFAYQCQEKGYYHILDNLYAEVINPETGKQAKSEGELVITPLWRKELPLIRFRTGDLVELDEIACACKVQNKLVFQKVLGRIGSEKKLGYSMVSLDDLYQDVQHSVNYQYPLFDKLLWRIKPQLRVSLLLTKRDDSDKLIIFLRRDNFNRFLRRTKPILDRLARQYEVGGEIILLPKTEFEKIENRYLDSRYLEKKNMPEFLVKIIQKYRINL